MKTKGSMSPSSARRILGYAIASLAAGMLLQSCAAPQGVDTEAFTLHPPVTVDISMNAGCPPSYTCWTSGQWTIKISEEPINTVNDGTGAEIHWTLIAGDWNFDNNKGIDFKNNGSWNPSRITDKEWKAASRKDGKIYKYVINLKHTSGLTFKWDPTVMN